jgi:hypothetical protein
VWCGVASGEIPYSLVPIPDPYSDFGIAAGIRPYRAGRTPSPGVRLCLHHKRKTECALLLTDELCTILQIICTSLWGLFRSAKPERGSQESKIRTRS